MSTDEGTMIITDSSKDFYKKRNLFLCVVCLLSTVVTLTAIGLGIGLIVKYSSKSSTSSFDFTSIKTKTIAMGFASDCSMCRNGYLGNLKSVDEQLAMQTGLYGSEIHLDSAFFIAAVAKTRRAVSASFSCERPTSLFGDIFSLRVQYTYPILCYSNACRLQYDQTVKIAFRNNLQPLSIHVNLTDGQNRDVQLKFCSFHTIVN